jgi:dystonin
VLSCQTLHDDIINQRGKARDVLATAKRLCRETSSLDSDPVLHDKMDELHRQNNSCAKLSADRMSYLEQAVPLAADFQDTLDNLSVCLDKLEEDVRQQEPPAISAEQINEQQNRLKVLKLNFIRFHSGGC